MPIGTRPRTAGKKHQNCVQLFVRSAFVATTCMEPTQRPCEDNIYECPCVLVRAISPTMYRTSNVMAQSDAKLATASPSVPQYEQLPCRTVKSNKVADKKMFLWQVGGHGQTGGTERMDRLSLNIFTSLYSTVGSEFLTTIQLLSYNGDSATSWCLPASQTKFITLWQIYCSHWFIVGVATMKPYLTREGFQLGRCCGAATSH